MTDLLALADRLDALAEGIEYTTVPAFDKDGAPDHPEAQGPTQESAAMRETAEALRAAAVVVEQARYIRSRFAALDAAGVLTPFLEPRVLLMRNGLDFVLQPFTKEKS